jgi:hypothetical protein
MHGIGVNNRPSRLPLTEGIKFVTLGIERQVAGCMNCIALLVLQSCNLAILQEARNSAAG